MSKARQKPALSRLRPALEMLEDRRMLAIVAWDGGGDGTSWDQAINWDGDVLPGIDDDVLIDVADQDVTVRIDSAVAIKSLTSSEALRLYLCDPRSGGSFYNRHTFNGTGTLTIAAGATVDVFGLLSLQRTVENFGVLNQPGNLVGNTISLGAALTNRVGGEFNLFDEADVTTADSNNRLLINQGTIIKSGTGRSEIKFRVELQNEGSITIDEGELAIDGGLRLGSARWEEGGALVLDEAFLRIDSGATFDIAANAAVRDGSPEDSRESSLMLNLGTFNITSGAQVSLTGLSQSGLLDIQDGAVELDEMFSAANGRWVVGSAGTLKLGRSDLAPDEPNHRLGINSSLTVRGTLIVENTSLETLEPLLIDGGRLQVTGGFLPQLADRFTVFVAEQPPITGIPEAVDQFPPSQPLGVDIENDAGVLDIIVVPKALQPDVRDDEFTTNEDTPLSISVLDNDSPLPIDSDAVLSLQAFRQPLHGTLARDENDSNILIYTPAANFSGFDIFRYAATDSVLSNAAFVRIDVLPVNDPPIAQDMSLATAVDTSIRIELNVTDPDGDPLTFDALQAEHGIVTNHGDGTLTYTPDAGFEGIDSFDYSADDPSGATGIATVTVSVQATTPEEDAASAGNQAREGVPEVIRLLKQAGETFNRDAQNIGPQPETPGLPDDAGDQLKATDKLNGFEETPIPEDPVNSVDDLKRFFEEAIRDAFNNDLFQESTFAIDFIQQGVGGLPPAPTANDIIQARFTASLANLTPDGSIDLDDEFMSLFSGLRDLASLDGSMDYASDLDLTLVFGVDRSGFYVSGESNVTLAISGNGSLNSNLNLLGTGAILSGEASTSLEFKLGEKPNVCEPGQIGMGTSLHWLSLLRSRDSTTCYIQFL